MELVCTSGRGKNSALCILQVRLKFNWFPYFFKRGLRPEINTAVEVPGCKALWSVYYKTNVVKPLEAVDGTVDLSQDDSMFTKFVVISRDDRTMV